jgi:hypothetical protein
MDGNNEETYRAINKGGREVIKRRKIKSETKFKQAFRTHK